MMKNLKCECCGAPLKINPYNPYFDNYFCDYCGSKYKANNEGVIRIETYQNPVRTLMAKMYMTDDAVKGIGEEKAAEYSIKNLSSNLAESLAPMLTIEKEYDPQYMRHIITAKVRVVEPDYRF